MKKCIVAFSIECTMEVEVSDNTSTDNDDFDELEIQSFVNVTDFSHKASIDWESIEIHGVRPEPND